MLPRAIKVADLKRLKPGRKLRIVHSLMGPCDKLRIVAKVTTVGLQFTGDGIKEGEVSYLSFPKGKDLHGDQSGFTIMEGNEVAAKYLAVDWETDPLF